MSNSSLSGKTVLIAEDDEDLRSLWAEHLIEQGCDVITAADGQAAIQTLQDREKELGHHHIDAIVSDWMMPGMDGPTFLKRLRKTSNWTSIPFLMVSGKVTKDILQHLVSTGVDAVLLKPFEPSSLITKLGEAVERRHEFELKGLFEV